MEIFYRLLFGHLLADFTFQTNYIAEWKRRSIWGLLAHVAIHPACYLFMAWPYMSSVWASPFDVALTGWICVGILTVLHFVEDWIRVSMVNRGVPDNTLFYLWDQAIHILFLWLLSPTSSQPLYNRLYVLGSVFVLVTHCATVTVWFIEKDIFGRDYPDTEEKYISMLQRLVLWLAFFLPHPWWMLVLVFVVVTFGRHVWMKKVDFSWTSVILGQLLAIACGLFSRFALGFHF
jgi:Protein of unknown function (DUF3307)